jgi:hypothetical protein
VWGALNDRFPLLLDGSDRVYLFISANGRPPSTFFPHSIIHTANPISAAAGRSQSRDPAEETFANNYRRNGPTQFANAHPRVSPKKKRTFVTATSPKTYHLKGMEFSTLNEKGDRNRREKKEKESNLSSWKLNFFFVIISTFETTGHYEIFKKLKETWIDMLLAEQL